MQGIAAMILAGGRGNRMDLLCHLRPKPALPFAGRFKVIDFSLSNCIYSEINNIAILTDYQRSHMAKYLRRWQSKNASLAKIEILEPQSGSYKGTADAVYQNLNYLRQLHEDRVLVLAGDHVYKLDYRKMLALHEQTKADVTVGVLQVPIEEAYRFGTVSLNGKSVIKSFLEKSTDSQSNLASMGIYIFNKDILIARLIEDAADSRSRHDFGYSILPKIVQQDRVFAYRFDGYWQDIGTVEAYYEANMELVREHPAFSLDGTSPVLTEEQNDSPPRITREAVVINSLVSAGCVVKGRVENSVLFPGVSIDEQAVIRNSIIMEGSVIGYHSIVDRCVLDERVNIGQLCYIGFGSSIIPGKYDVTILGKGVTVPPHTAIGRNCKILPYVGTKDFPATVVTHDSIISPRVTKSILVRS